MPGFASIATGGGRSLSALWESGDGELQRSWQHGQQPKDGGVVDRLAISESVRGIEPGRIDTDQAGPITTTSCDSWNDYDLIPCADGKTRRIKSGLMPLVNGIPGRVGLIRGYGNAIVPQIAAEFIKAYGDIK